MWSQVARAWVTAFVLAVRAGADGVPAESAAERDVRMAWWREARFGLFIHWGLYSIPAGEWNGRTDHAEWILHTAQIPREQYDALRARFNPVKFNADAWAQLARDAGMKYIVITSKHHDGFCLFDSTYTHHDVMATPFQRDILRELSSACAANGLRIGWYHSIMDWHQPDYLPRRDWEARSAEGADFNRYVAHLRHQVTELLTNYGDVGVMWFDGEWEDTWTHALGRPLYDLCRELQPNVIVNNRVDKGRQGMAGLTAEGDFAGDFGTPEQEIPVSGLPGVDWESCITMNDHWGFNRADHHWKSSRDLIRMLVDVASKGGNLLLNVGPTAGGEFPPECVERLREIGAWMKVNGESIHGTSASPLPPLPWGRCTTKKLEGGTTRLYLHVFDWPKDGQLIVPGLDADPTARAALLAQPGLPLRLELIQGTSASISVPASPLDEACTVVVVDVNR